MACSSCAPSSDPDARDLGPVADRRLSAEQPGFGGGEFVVGQRAPLVQGRELLELIGYRRCRGGRVLGRRVRSGRRLLLQGGETFVLLVLLLSLFRRPLRDPLAGDIGATPHHGCSHQRASSTEHDSLPTSRLAADCSAWAPPRLRVARPRLADTTFGGWYGNSSRSARQSPAQHRQYASGASDGHARSAAPPVTSTPRLAPGSALSLVRATGK